MSIEPIGFGRNGARMNKLVAVVTMSAFISISASSLAQVPVKDSMVRAPSINQARSKKEAAEHLRKGEMVASSDNQPSSPKNKAAFLAFLSALFRK
jgi:hypothetical protein